MAKGSTARTSGTSGRARLRCCRAHAGARAIPADLDRLIHERVRLGIVTLSLSIAPIPSTELKAMLKTTDGNLSVHARKLEEAELHRVHEIVRRSSTKTEYRLTAGRAKGAGALLNHMEALIRATREG